MAMLNRPIHTPPWLRVEIAEDPVFGQHFNVGVRCADGWAHLVSMPINVVNFDDVVHREKVIAYRHAHEFITNQLAIETLEKT